MPDFIDHLPIKAQFKYLKSHIHPVYVPANLAGLISLLGAPVSPHMDTGTHTHTHRCFACIQLCVFFDCACVCMFVHVCVQDPYHTHHLLSQSQSSADSVSISNWASGDAKARCSHTLSHFCTHTHTGHTQIHTLILCACQFSERHQNSITWFSTRVIL